MFYDLNVCFVLLALRVIFASFNLAYEMWLLVIFHFDLEVEFSNLLSVLSRISKLAVH